METMTDEFKEKIMEAVRNRITADNITIRKVSRNNGVFYNGLYICTGEKIEPIVNLDEYYEKYLSYGDLHEIADEIRDEFYSRSMNIPKGMYREIKGYENYEKAKESLYITLVGAEKNRNPSIIQREFLDLLIIPKLLVKSGSGKGVSSIKIRRDFLKMWNVTEEQLLKDAYSNSEKLRPANVKSMREMMYEDFCSSVVKGAANDPDSENMIPEELEPALERALEEVTGGKFSIVPQMYVITNDLKTNGASVVLYDGILEELADRLDSDLLILPSSIHECLAVALNDYESDMPECAGQMVKEVNEDSTLLDKTEILSDHAYVFVRNTGKLQCA